MRSRSLQGFQGVVLPRPMAARLARILRLGLLGLALAPSFCLGVGQTGLLAAPLTPQGQPAAFLVPPPPPPPPMPLASPAPDGAASPPSAPVGVAALVNPDPALQRLVASAAGACRAALARRFASSPPRVEAWLVPGLTIAIEAGERSLAAVQRDGLAFGWMVRGKPDPLPIGVCRTDGAGSVRAIEVQPD